ncbi:Cuz1p KNAG_0F01500 [Huiozyma naganishii CBS 8797]|uniref:AN1-type domain-containing protein n=1 Tax=Huiozyma naganishii (strain ATCC MYA-139 / BCRC 22969 / CBS 8797 / KCTC 17520 / NBRC 10181 / NCYC 3082 / Yp74L-3) TaxID=1071383 RepID=J7RMM2_HUIN7|nr:hypothetical protein KNAG_0F01500 [Kazachstania naganishii CBS 8797]CCK70818.1 hypothetical protein KNAG_0F01500 [Kazachstania naganishii CBS 8797]
MSLKPEVGMLDVGTHCAFCRQLDFLPFHCGACGGDYCELHRTKSAHHCASLLGNNEGKKDPANSGQTQPTSHGERYFQALLPEKGYIRVKSDGTGSGKSPPQQPRTVKSTMGTTAMSKLLKFFQRTKQRQSSSSSSSSSFSPRRPPNRVVQLAQLKKRCRGDSKIPQDNRVYVICHAVSERDAEGVPLFVNRMWPIGRALDYIAQELNVSNTNNKMGTAEAEKLFIYMNNGRDDQLVELNTGERVQNTIHDLDSLYLIRGKLQQ